MKTRKNKLPGKVGDVTLKGIHRWYKSVFERLGYMILAKSKGMTDKITVYKNSVARLKEAVENKIDKVYDTDKVTDLKIMLRDIEILLKHINKDF